MPKKLADTAVTGARGVNIIERIVLEMGFGWHPSSGALDTGVDGIIDIRDPLSRESLNLIVQVQSKATLGRFAGETDQGFHYICDPDDLEHWMRGNAPLILVRVRPPDEAYWVSIKDYFRDERTRKSRRIEFDKRLHRFDKSARESILELAVPRMLGTVLSRAKRPEHLLSNLFPVQFPTSYCVAPTHCESAAEISERMDIATSSTAPRDWVLHRKRIYSFRNLREPMWREVCAQDDCEVRATKELSGSNDRATAGVFIDLLGRCLREMLHDRLSYFQTREILYFRATADCSPIEIEYPGLSKRSDRCVFKGYGHRRDAPELPSYFRHAAFNWQFRRFDDEWRLQLTPTYHYTRDGREPYVYYEDRLKKMRQLERNGSLLGQMMMWRHVLAPVLTPDLFAPPSQVYPFLRFSPCLSLDAEYGVDDDLWLGLEDDQSEIDTDLDEAEVDAAEAQTLDLELDFES